MRFPVETRSKVAATRTPVERIWALSLRAIRLLPVEIDIVSFPREAPHYNSAAPQYLVATIPLGYQPSKDTFGIKVRGLNNWGQLLSRSFNHVILAT
jgi:hypothetical protein